MQGFVCIACMTPSNHANPLITTTIINTSITIARGASQPPGKRLEESERRLYLLIEGM